MQLELTSTERTQVKTALIHEAHAWQERAMLAKRNNATFEAEIETAAKLLQLARKF